jgi:adenylate cyclase
MTTEHFKRKLTAILSADVKGYSRLMQDDEEATVRTITAYREVMTDHIQGHDGRVVDAKGDNVLAEFSSVVDAVRCGVAVQKELKEKNNNLSENKRMEFRIGINLGDVIEEGDTIYGDGVNIAARLEGLSEGGGICISGAAFDQIGKKLPLGYEYRGEQTVKNIEKPVRVYKVLMEPEYAGKVIGREKPKMKQWRWAAIGGMVVLIVVAGILAVWHHYLRPQFEPAKVEKMAFPLPEKPSIAVLPFVNMSEDPNQEYFSDGITEDIITTLSKIPRLFVIARNSTFTYKGKPVKIQKVSEDLGVRYVLEGSVRKSGERVRITAQLIDATMGHHLWAEKYDRDLKDIFALQDEVTKKIVRALVVKLTEDERKLLVHKKTGSLEAYDHILRGIDYFLRMTGEENAAARGMFKRAIELDADYAVAYSWLGWTYWMEWSFEWSQDPTSLDRALELAQRALSLDDSLSDAHALLGKVYLWKKQYDQAISELEKTVALDPNDADGLAGLGEILYFAGRPEEAIELIKKAIRLNPIPPVWYFHGLGHAYYLAGHYNEAIAALKRTLNRNPNFWPAHVYLAASYIELGLVADARAEAAKILRINPRFSFEGKKQKLPYKDQSVVERLEESLRKAGLPDKPPLPLPDKPSIAVLPFTNMSGDPEQEYFSDGITEEIITALSKTPKLFVIARNSTFTYKGKPVKVQQVGRQLGVRYVLEGSVRKAGDKVRITAQLVDANTGHHLWADRYNRDLKNIFALQDEITMKILKSLQVKLIEGEQARILGKGTTNLEAYIKFLRAREHFFRMNKHGSMRARQLAKKSIALDSKYASPHTILALTHMMDLWFRFTDSPEASMKLAIEAAQRALALDDSDPGTHVGLCMLYIMQRQYDKAINAGKRAVALSPSGASAYSALATAFMYAGRHQEAISLFKKAISLNPFPPSIYLRNLGSAYRMAELNEEAVVEYKKSLQQNPDDLFTHLGLVVAYVSLGREQEARAEAMEILRIHPTFSLEHHAETLPYKNQSDKDHFISALRKAGLK